MKDLALKKKFQDILSSDGIKDEISEVTIKRPDSLIGEHFGSICEYITIEFEGGKRAPKVLFVKRAVPVNDPQQGMMMKGIMVNEGKFLTTFVSEMKEFCERKLGADNDVRVESLFPKTYLANENEIIMENMAVQDYFMLNKKEFQSFEMATVVIKSLAKIHAISYCLIKQAGGRESYVKTHPNFTEMMYSGGAEEMISAMFEPTFASMLKMIEEHAPVAFKKLNAYQGKLAATMKEAVISPSLLEVVNHGDCWNNNMLFSPETRKNPELAKLIFVDLQLGRIGSPCLDLAYYIFTSTKPEVRQRTKELLTIYFNEISKLVERLGEEFTFTFEDFLLDYGVKSKLGFFTGLIITCALDGIKNHDTKKSNGNMMEEFQTLLSTWINDNPDMAEEIATEAQRKVQDFEILGTF